MDSRKEFRIAVIDMNNGAPNEGIKSILTILSSYEKEHALDFSIHTFDLRAKNEIPDINYDIYISSGGPGSPFDGKNTTWENSFFTLLDRIKNYNTNYDDKKHGFLICYSFQLACRKYNLGTVTGRSSTSFGIFPVSLTHQGESDTIFHGLPNPFFAFDNRDWQVLDSNDEIFTKPDVEVLALEKERLHIDMERCLMSIRFSREMIGTQFHPEADFHGMKNLNLKNPDRIMLTRQLILPNFLDQAIQSLKDKEDDQHL